MLRRLFALLCVSFALSPAARGSLHDESSGAGIAEAGLPAEARATLRLIDSGDEHAQVRGAKQVRLESDDVGGHGQKMRESDAVGGL